MKKYNYKTIPDLLLNKEWQIKANTIETNFKNVRDKICNTFESLEKEFSSQKNFKMYYTINTIGKCESKNNN